LIKKFKLPTQYTVLEPPFCCLVKDWERIQELDTKLGEGMGVLWEVMKPSNGSMK